MKKIDKDMLVRIGTVLVIILLTCAVIWGAWRPKKTNQPAATAQNNTVPPTTTPSESTPPTSSVTSADPQTIYPDAIAHLSAKKDLYYTVTGKRGYTRGSSTFSESFTQNIIIKDLNKPEMAAQVKEKLQIGNYIIDSVENYYQGAAYFTTQGTGIQAQTAPEDYLARYVPALTITPELYKQITATKSDAAAVIKFSNPTALESWVKAKGLQSASGEMVVDKNGNIKKCTYSATYTQNQTTCTLEITVEINDGAVPSLVPPTPSNYMPLTDPDTVKILERACGYLSSASALRSVYLEEIYCQSFGDSRKQETQLSVNRGSDLTAEISTSTEKTNTGQPGAVEATTFLEIFKDNTYQYSIGEAFETAAVDQKTMLEYCQLILVGTILLPEHIRSATVSLTDNVYRIDFQTTEDYAKILAEDAFLIMYPNAPHPEELAAPYKTESVSAYLTIDAMTGFPLSAGFSYKGSSTISNLPYELFFKADQTYTVSASTP